MLVSTLHNITTGIFVALPFYPVKSKDVQVEYLTMHLLLYITYIRVYDGITMFLTVTAVDSNGTCNMEKVSSTLLFKTIRIHTRHFLIPLLTTDAVFKIKSGHSQTFYFTDTLMHRYLKQLFASCKGTLQ